MGALHRNIQDIFSRHRVQIMTPNYVADPDRPKLVPPDRWHLPPADPTPEGSTAPEGGPA